MTNNCDIATAVGAEDLGLTAEILADASGAIRLANEAGKVSADQLHQTLLVLLHSNFAAVAKNRGVDAGRRRRRAAPEERPRHLGRAGACCLRRLRAKGRQP